MEDLHQYMEEEYDQLTYIDLFTGELVKKGRKISLKG